jgi:transcriptional regulator with PAS, ATPase and Fis domain
MNNGEKKEELKEFEANPYNPEKSSPEDVMRIFFVNDVPIIPVISKKGALIGVLKKDDVISELSDIERTKNQKIDQFITRLSRKMTLDELLPYVSNIQEFTVINMFGEVQGKWSRIDLLEASENRKNNKVGSADIEKQKEEQVLEWMIYLILEHIPRALYALNQHGKTIFYNSHFEELYLSSMKKDVDVKFIENSFGQHDKNDFYYRSGVKEEMFFYNKDMDIYYEKIPLLSNDRPVGFLIYCDRNSSENDDKTISRTKGKSLSEMLGAVERRLIVDVLKSKKYDIGKTAEELKMSKQALRKKISGHGIDLPGKNGS